MFTRSKWIWPSSDTQKMQHAYFFFSADTSESIPPSAVLSISSETKYYLFINGKLCVFDGGLFRESLPGCGYFDSIDIAPYLKRGLNEITVDVVYYKSGGRNNSLCEKPGLLLSCDTLGIYSDESTLCEVCDAYIQPTASERTFLYGGGHTAYDARIRPFASCPVISEKAKGATVLGRYGDSPWGELLLRPIPLFDFSEIKETTFEHIENTYRLKLPYAMHFSPYFKVNAKSGTVITVHSDRYKVNGGPGDDHNRYFGHRAEYICRDGIQEFEMRDWIFGEEMTASVSGDAEMISLGYRESRYPTNIITSFECSDPRVNKLFDKAARTLTVCMRENFMDCPDRERGQWIGDVSVQAPQVVYLLDKNGMLLLKKAILDFINLRKGDVLVGNVPGDNFSELPSQSLNAISTLGMISAYYEATKDTDILKAAFEPSVRYLMLWEIDSDGVVLPRRGNWEWYDHLYNVDKPILNICWYYSALRFAKANADLLSDHRYDAFIKERMDAIEAHFDQRYWREGEGCYSSGDLTDDRANAMAVLSGLCTSEKYPKIRNVLKSVFCATPYMENYVLCALCEMGYKEDAFARMMSRYEPLIASENSTLHEDFFRLGTRNHAWSGGPVTVLLRYFVGINGDLSVSDTDISPLSFLKCSFHDHGGKTIQIKKQN